MDTPYWRLLELLPIKQFPKNGQYWKTVICKNENPVAVLQSVATLPYTTGIQGVVYLHNDHFILIGTQRIPYS